MSVFRPLSKELLKKMFLKVLAEENFNAQVNSTNSSDYISIIETRITEYYNIEELNEIEYESCLKAVKELEKEGIITSSSNDSELFKSITPKGQEYFEQYVKDLQLPSFEVYHYITRWDLRSEVMQDYLSGNYELSIEKAFKLLEERVKENTIKKPLGLDSENVSNYYIADDGAVRYCNFNTQDELDSLNRIMKGTMLWFKDPSTDNVITSNNAEAAAQILVFANMHLNLIDK